MTYFEVGENSSGIVLWHVKFNRDLQWSRIRVTTSIYTLYAVKKMLINSWILIANEFQSIF